MVVVGVVPPKCTQSPNSGSNSRLRVSITPQPLSHSIDLMANEQQRLRNFVFTLNNPVREGPDFLEDLRGALPIRCVIFQLEEGEQGTRHFQGYVELTSQLSFGRVKAAIPGAHLEARKGSPQQAWDYASKEETRVSGPWSYGEVSSPGRRNDIRDALATYHSHGMGQAALDHPDVFVKYWRGMYAYRRELLYVQPRPPLEEVTLLYGPPGCGKTHFVAEKYDIPRECAKLNLAEGWFDGYVGQRYCLLDDFDGARSKLRLATLLQVLDKYPVQVPVKGDHVPLIAERMFVSTNYHPQQWYDWGDRANQFDAVKRRFTHVVYYYEPRKYFILEPGAYPDLWKLFWAGVTVHPDGGPVDPNTWYTFLKKNIVDYVNEHEAWFKSRVVIDLLSDDD